MFQMKHRRGSVRGSIALYVSYMYGLITCSFVTHSRVLLRVVRGLRKDVCSHEILQYEQASICDATRATRW
jgi:hypothetical protein